MRNAVVIATLLLCACAVDKLALAPQAGIDLSGHWRLNALESDDAQHLIQSQKLDLSKLPDVNGSQRGQSGRGRPRRDGSPIGLGAPSLPGMGALSEVLGWPANEVLIEQTAGGVVAMTSAGVKQMYQPAAKGKSKARGRPAQSAVCGWEDRTLVVQGGVEDDDNPPFEQRYSLSADDRRLIEVVRFKSGLSAGFTMSRVWDRVESVEPQIIHPAN